MISKTGPLTAICPRNWSVGLRGMASSFRVKIEAEYIPKTGNPNSVFRERKNFLLSQMKNLIY